VHRVRFLSPVLVSMILGAAPAAQAAEAVLAVAPDASGITAFGGEVVLSQHDAATGRWALMRLRNGALERLPVAERSVPFDADLGPDAAGRPIVVYSRCKQEPEMTSGLAPTPDWQTARSCDIYKLPLTGDTPERKLVAASSAGKSETTPSTWWGALAFVRFRDGVSVPTIEYLPHATATRFASADPVTGALGTATTPGGLAAGSARDGATIYWLRVTKDLAHTPVPGAGSCTTAAGCELVASPAPAYAASASRSQFPPAEIDVVRSDLGYRWMTGPGGVRVLAPPARVQCAPSASPAAVYMSAQWRGGRHTVRVLRQDPGEPTRQVGSVQKRSLATGVYIAIPRLLRCGDRTRLTYEVTTGDYKQHVSFTVARAGLGRGPR
jgi:hypothetical protein